MVLNAFKPLSPRPFPIPGRELPMEKGSLSVSYYLETQNSILMLFSGEETL